MLISLGEYFSEFEFDPENTNKNVPEKSRFNCSWFELDNVVHTNGPEISDENVLEIIETDKDGYRLYVLQEIEKYFSKIFVINFIKIKYYEVDSKTLMVLNISPSNESIFFESKDGKNLSPKFFIRIDNSTKELIGQELSNYVIQQFGKN